MTKFTNHDGVILTIRYFLNIIISVFVFLLLSLLLEAYKWSMLVGIVGPDKSQIGAGLSRAFNHLSMFSRG